MLKPVVLAVHGPVVLWSGVLTEYTFVTVQFNGWFNKGILAEPGPGELAQINKPVFNHIYRISD